MIIDHMKLFNKTWRILICFSLALCSTGLWGESVPFQSGINYQIFREWEEPFNPDQLARLLLIASGLPDNRMADYLDSIHAILKESESWVSPDRSIRENAESLLLFMHKEILNRYISTQTKVDMLLENGNYNCVSSAVFYMLIARHNNILIKGIHTVDHAFCQLPGGEGESDIDIETTNEWGFDPGSRKEFQSSFTNKTGFVYVPPGQYSSRVLQGDRDMAGLILQNRIVELQKKNLHQDALTLAADRLVLTGSPQALSDYYDTVQNAAAQFNSKKEYEKGISIINRAETGTRGISDSLKETRSRIIFNACAEAVNHNQIEKAGIILNEYREFISEKDVEDIRKIITQRELELRSKEEFSLLLIDDIKKAADSSFLTLSQASSLASYHYSRQAEALSKAGKHKDALLFLQNVPDWVSEDREYRRVLSILKQNAAIEYHNRIVKLLQSDEQVQAEALLNEALELVPGNNLLLQDKKTISR